MAGEGGVGCCLEGREDAALLALDVALGDLEVFAGELVWEAEERLVLCSVVCKEGCPVRGKELERILRGAGGSLH